MFSRNRFSRRKLGLIPVDSTKNIVQFNGGVVAASTSVFILAQAVTPASIDETDAAKTFYCEDSSSIKSMSIQGRILNAGLADVGSVVVCLRKNEGNLYPALSLANMNSLGTQTSSKPRIFHCEQAIPGSQVSGAPMLLFSIKVPRRFHRMQHSDRWELWVGNNSGNQVNVCGMCVYKWYR